MKNKNAKVMNKINNVVKNVLLSVTPEQETKKEEVKKVSMLHSVLASSTGLTASRTIKNKNKFSKDETILRGYEVCKDIINKEGFTKENVFSLMKEYYEKNPLDVQGKDIKRPQRYLASLCCKASNKERSTSTFMQDIKEIGKPQCRLVIKQAFPAFEDNILDIIFKATFTPARSK